MSQVVKVQKVAKGFKMDPCGNPRPRRDSRGRCGLGARSERRDNKIENFSYDSVVEIFPIFLVTQCAYEVSIQVQLNRITELGGKRERKRPSFDISPQQQQQCVLIQSL